MRGGDMGDKGVAAVVGDIGGAKELLPAMQILEKRNLCIQWFVDPGPEARAGVILTNAGVSYEKRLPDPNDKPSVIVVGTSATAVSAQIIWTRFGREKGIPVIWLEDWFGTGSRKNTQVTAPNMMLTIHPIAEGIARNVRMDLPTKTVGKPSFSRIPTLIEKRLEIREQARRELRIMEGEFLVHWIFTGAPAERPWEQIEEFRRAGNQLAGSSTLMMPRFHPKHLKKVRLEAAMKEVLGDRFVAPAIGLDSAIAASDLVVADWGTTDAFTALFLSVPVATTLFPNDFDERVEIGFIGGIPPILMRTEGVYREWGLVKATDICNRVRYIAEHRELAAFITQNRARGFQDMCEPDAAKRIADEISAYLE